MKSIIFGKLGGLLLVATLLLLGLQQITGLVRERKALHENAATSVAQSLAGSQTLLGPLVQVSCTEKWTAKGEKGPVLQRRDFAMAVTPSVLNVGGTSQVEARARRLHATQVFTFKSRITAQWADLKALEGARQFASSTVQCRSAVLMLAVSDARGIRQADVRINGAAQVVQAGTHHAAYPRGVQVDLPAGINLGAPFKAEIELELVGTESLSIVPLGDTTQVSLTSNWPHPSFYGQFLPSERKVSDQGFEASWRVSALASSAQQSVVNEGRLCNGSRTQEDPPPLLATTEAVTAAAANTACVETLDVSFIDPINTYSLSDRATKYGLLFIALTFVAVGLFEFMRGLRVHPVRKR